MATSYEPFGFNRLRRKIVDGVVIGIVDERDALVDFNGSISVGTGDVTGPAGAATGVVAVFNDTTGKVLRAGVPGTDYPTVASVTSAASAASTAQTTADTANSAAASASAAATTANTNANTALSTANATASTLTTHTALAQAHGISAFMATVVPAADAPTALTALGGATTASVALKANIASPTLTGTPAAPTAAAATNTTQIATTAFVQTEIVAKANLASPTFTGVPAAPTAAAATSTTQVATTAFVTTADNLKVTAAGGTLTAGTVAGETTYSGAAIVTGTAMGANVINVALSRNTKSVSADTTFTFSATPATGKRFEMTLTSTATVSITITIPSSFSVATGSLITSFYLQPADVREIVWSQTAGRLTVYGEQEPADISTPTAGIHMLTDGASREMRGMRVFSISSAAITTSTNTITVNTPTNHETYTGAVWYLAQQSTVGFTTYDATTVGYGEITRVDDDTFTIPRIKGPTSGSNTSLFWAVCQQQFTHQNPFIYFNSEINCGIRQFANFAAGSNNPENVLSAAHELEKEYQGRFNVLNTTMGLGNAVLYALSNAQSIATMLSINIPIVTTILDYWTARGVLVILQGIPASEGATGEATAYAVAMDEAMTNLVNDRYRGKVVYLALSSLGVLPGGGVVDPLMVNTGDGVHQNAAGAEAVGRAMAELWRALRPIPPRSPLIFSTLDYRSQDVDSNQICEATRVGTGQAASGLDADFSGTIWNDFAAGTITAGSSAASVAFAIEGEPEGYGYTQTWRITSTGGGNILTLALTGAAGSTLMFDRITPGEEYEGWLRYRFAPSSTTVCLDWGIRVMANVTYGTSKLCVLAAMATNDSAFTDNDAPFGKDLSLWIPRHKIPVGITSYYIEYKCRLRSAVSGTIDCATDRISLRKVS